MAKPNAAVNASTPRSPSPEPIYSGDGKRLNTREYRKRYDIRRSFFLDCFNIREFNFKFKVVRGIIW